VLVNLFTGFDGNSPSISTGQSSAKQLKVDRTSVYSSNY